MRHRSRRILTSHAHRRPPLDARPGHTRVLAGRAGKIRGDEADLWLRENDLDFGASDRDRRVRVPTDLDAWLATFEDALLAPETKTKQVIYCLQGEHGGPVKIGFSHELQLVRQRMLSIQCGNPDTLTVRRVVYGSARDERTIHLSFATHRIRGEWFRPEGLVARFAHAI